MKLATRSMQQTRLLLRQIKALKELLEKVNMDDISMHRLQRSTLAKRN